MDQAIDSPRHTTNAASAAKNKAPGPETRTGRTTQPIAATKTAAAPIQKSRPWLEPLPKKSAAQASPPAAAPPTAGQRIGREANTGRIGASLPDVRNSDLMPIPAYKALTTDSWQAHSHPARWARSSLESASSAAARPRMPKFLKPLILLIATMALAAGVLGVGKAEARSTSVCSKALIHDWYVDGRVDKTYPVHCYREALKDIPEDQLIYGTLRDDLTRALQSVIRKHNGSAAAPQHRDRAVGENRPRCRSGPGCRDPRPADRGRERRRAATRVLCTGAGQAPAGTRPASSSDRTSCGPTSSVHLRPSGCLATEHRPRRPAWAPLLQDSQRRAAR